MAVVRWTPFRELARMRDEMDRVFGQLWGGLPEPFGAEGGFRVPAVDVYTQEGQLVVQADLPGVTKDQVQVDITDEAVTISAEVNNENVEERDGWLHRERFSGKLRRVVRLPAAVDASGGSAKLEDGVLTVRLPLKEPEAAGRRLTVE